MQILHYIFSVCVVMLSDVVMRSTCSLQVWAGLQSGSLVTNMFAKDLDAGENGTVIHSLVTGEL